MPGIIFNPFRKKDLEEPSLSMLNEFWRKLAEQINELWGLTGPVLLHDDLDLQGHSILNATLAGAAASSSSTAPSLYGPHSNRPNAAGTAEGTLYLETDRTVLYQLQLVSSVKRWVYIAGIMQGLFSGRPLASSLGPGDTGLLYHAGDNGQVYKFTYPAWSTMNLRGPLIEGTNAERLAGGRCDAKNLSVGTEFFETDTLLKYMVQTVAGVNTWIAEPAADIDVQKAGALIGTRRIVNFTEDGNVTLTMADNPGATRIDIGVQAIPGGGVAPFTTLFEWLPYSYNAVPNPSWANDLSLSYTGAGAYTLFTDAAATNALQLGPNLTAAVFSNANPLQLAVNGHGLSTGDQIYITGCIDNGVSPPGNWSALNGLWTVTKVNANLFTVPFDSRFINGLHANQVASYFGYNNWPSFNNATGQVEHSPCATFMNPKGSAANVFLLTFGGTVASGAGRLLYFVVDYLPYTTGGDASGIVVGTELNHYRFVIGATPAVTVYKRIAGVDYQQCAAVSTSATGHGWQRAEILVNTSGARVGNYRAGAAALWINGLPVFKSHMNAAEPTLPLGAAVSISLRMPGSANARTNYVYCSRVAAYSVPPEFEQFIS